MWACVFSLCVKLTFKATQFELLMGSWCDITMKGLSFKYQIQLNSSLKQSYSGGYKFYLATYLHTLRSGAAIPMK